MDGMAYFEDERDWAYRPRKQKIVAVKELFGEFMCGNSGILLLVAKWRSASINQQPLFTEIKAGHVASAVIYRAALKCTKTLWYLRTKMMIF